MATILYYYLYEDTLKIITQYNKYNNKIVIEIFKIYIIWR